MEIGRSCRRASFSLRQRRGKVILKELNLLHLQSLELFSGVRKILGPVNLSLEQGEWATLESVDGQGRSLILRYIAGRSKGISARGSFQWLGREIKPKPQSDIFFIPEEPRIFEGLSVAQNLFLQDGPRLLPVHALTLAASQILSRLPVKIPLEEDARFLNESERFWLEIARLILKPRKLVLIDEIPRGLSGSEKEMCAHFLRQLQDQGLSLLDTSGINPHARIVSLKKAPEVLTENFRRPQFAQNSTQQSDVLSIQKTADEQVVGLRSGEILGFLGSKNSGRRELWDELLRYRNHQQTDQKFEISSALQKPRISFVSGFRSATGLFEGRSSIFNLCFPLPSRRRKSRELFQHYADLFRLENKDPRARIESLSREDRQKVLLARALKENPRILCLEELTRGLSMDVRYQLFQIIRQLADSGVSVILLSWNLREMVRLCDRIIWLRKEGAWETWQGQPEVLQRWEQQSSYRGSS